MKKILVLASGDLNYDSRPSLIGYTLMNAGYCVYIESIKTRKVIDKDYDVIHAVDMPALQLAIKNKGNAKIVYDALELWREDCTTIDAIDRKLADGPSWAKHVDRIFVESIPSYDYIRYILNRPIPIDIVRVAKPKQYEKYEKPNNKNFTLIFMGCISDTRFLKEAIEVVDEYDDVRLLISGCPQGDKSYKEIMVAINKSKNTKFIGQIHFTEVIPQTRKADCVLNMVTPHNYNNASGLTNKQFEAMIAGRPIICSENTYSGKFTEKYETGVVVQYSKNGLRTGINLLNNLELREYYGRKAFWCGQHNFNWEIESKKVVKAYKEMLK